METVSARAEKVFGEIPAQSAKLSRNLGPGTQGCIFLYLCDFVNKCIAPTESVFIAARPATTTKTPDNRSGVSPLEEPARASRRT